MELLPMFVAGLAVFAIILTILTLVLNFFIKIQSKSKSDAGKGLVLKWPLMALYVSLLIICIVVNNTKKENVEKENNMGDIINETSLILSNASNRLDLIFSEVSMSLQNMKRVTDDIGPKVKTVKTNFEEKFEIKALHEQPRDTQFLVESVWYKPEQWLEDLDVNKCGTKLSFEKSAFRKQFVDLSINTYEMTKDLESSINKWNIEFEVLAGEQQKLDYGKSSIDSHLNGMRKMIKAFQTGVNDSKTTREKWNQKVVEMAPEFDTRMIIKLIVTVTCTVLVFPYILSITGTFDKRYLGSNFMAKSVGIAIYIIGIVTIINAGIVINVSLGEQGQFDCPLQNGDFGLSDFISPFSLHEMNSFSICDSSNSTFYSHLGNGSLVPSESIVRNLEIEEYKKKMLTVFNTHSNSLKTFEIPPQNAQRLITIKSIIDDLDGLMGKNCFNESQIPKAVFHLDSLKRLSYQISLFEKSAKKFNENILKVESIFGSILDSVYVDIVTSFDLPIKQISDKIHSIDFSCDPIIDLYANIGYSICQQFDVPLNIYWVYLIIIILVCLVSLILHIFAYRNLKSVIDNEITPPEEPVNPAAIIQPVQPMVVQPQKNKKNKKKGKAKF